MTLSSNVSRILLGLGAAVGIIGIVVWALEVQVNLPDWMVRVALLKLAFLGSVGLLAAGALIGRHPKTRTLQHRPPAALGEGAPGIMTAPRQKDPVVPDRRDNVP